MNDTDPEACSTHSCEDDDPDEVADSVRVVPLVMVRTCELYMLYVVEFSVVERVK